MISKCILFQFFKDQAESKQGHEGGGVAKDTGGKEVGDISVKIKLTTFCMHLTLCNQVDLHVEFCYFFS